MWLEDSREIAAGVGEAIFWNALCIGLVMYVYREQVSLEDRWPAAEIAWYALLQVACAVGAVLWHRKRGEFLVVIGLILGFAGFLLLTGMCWYGRALPGD